MKYIFDLNYEIKYCHDCPMLIRTYVYSEPVTRCGLSNKSVKKLNYRPVWCKLESQDN